MEQDILHASAIESIRKTAVFVMVYVKQALCGQIPACAITDHSGHSVFIFGSEWLLASQRDSFAELAVNSAL
jgi:hypothetical protein